MDYKLNVSMQICIPNRDNECSRLNSLFDPANENCQVTVTTVTFNCLICPRVSNMKSTLYFHITILAHPFDLVLDESICIMEAIYCCKMGTG